MKRKINLFVGIFCLLSAIVTLIGGHLGFTVLNFMLGGANLGVF